MKEYWRWQERSVKLPTSKYSLFGDQESNIGVWEEDTWHPVFGNNVIIMFSIHSENKYESAIKFFYKMSHEQVGTFPK
jgi:hypothetical protein